MIDNTQPQPPTASRRMRWTAVFARFALWATIVFWLLFGATWGLLHGWIVPRIEEFRPRLEMQASKALGAPVQIGHITARSEGLIPSFELRNVTLQDQAGRQALLLPRVLAALSPASLWGGGFEQLVIDQPVLEIRRTPDGKVYVGGLDVDASRTDGHAAADWFFSQTEFAIKGGTVRWTDEVAKAPTLELMQVDAVLRNSSRKHAFRLDATPPALWGDRFSLRGEFRQPLLSKGAGRWDQWTGQLYAEFNRVGDVSRIKQYLTNTLGIDPRAGSGSLRGWADIGKGQLLGATLDVALHGVDVQLGKSLQPLALASATGRVSGKLFEDGFELATEGLSFNTQDGLRWPGGNLAITSLGTAGKTTQKNELKADKLDLAAVGQIANRLPLGTATHALIASFEPKGLVQTLDARWQQGLNADITYTAKGRVTGLELAALPSQLLRTQPTQGTQSTATASHQPGRPGISGADVVFDMSHLGGKAAVSLVQGHLDVPGVFEDPRVVLDKLSMDTQWTLTKNKTGGGEKIDLQMRDIKFSGADADGTAQASWHSGDAKPGAKQDASLGVLDLKGVISRGNGARVHRYLPLVLVEQVRHYVRDAVVQGDVSDVRFVVKGAVGDIPFAEPGKGDFKISATVKKGTFAYVPKAIQPKDAQAWPMLTDISAELVFNRASLEVNGVVAKVAGLSGLQLVKADARIANLTNSAAVEVHAKVKGPLNEALGFVNASPLATRCVKKIFCS